MFSLGKEISVGKIVSKEPRQRVSDFKSGFEFYTRSVHNNYINCLLLSFRTSVIYVKDTGMFYSVQNLNLQLQFYIEDEIKDSKIHELN